ncbi:MAG: arylsulfatase [Acidobacteriaceae bacterium]
MDRRDFLALSGAALLGNGVKVATQENATSVAPAASENPVSTVHRDRPNILLLMADQFRMNCAGIYGNKVIRTPNLDRLGQEGICFQNAYSTTPTCTPARTALLTGLGPWSHGMLGMTHMATSRYPVEKARAMAAAGYYTTSIGKNHYYPDRNPHGYHHVICDEHCSYWFHKEGPQQPSSVEQRCDYESFFWSQRPDSDPHLTGLSWNDHRGRPFAYADEKLHPTHWTGETAVRFLRNYNRQEPFFLKVSFIRPHSPYDPPERCFKMYEDAHLPEAKVGDWASRYAPRSSASNDLWHGKLPPEEIRTSRQAYYGSVTFVDEQIGRILEVLEQRKLLDETLILFISDHGDMLGDQNLWRKSYGYEQSAHVPMLMRPAAGMGLGPAGQVIANPVEIRDVLPTFLDTAGVPVPESIEGRSLLQLVKTKGDGWRPYIDLEHNICYGAANHWNGLTDGRWKYLYLAMDGEEQLFHLEKDPNELNDLAGLPQYETELRVWRGRMVQHLEERGNLWVRNGKLVPRPHGMMLSPNFPGYVPADKIDGFR